MNDPGLPARVALIGARGRADARRARGLVSLVVAAALGAAVGPAHAATLRVPEDFGTLDMAIGAAQDGDTLSVAAGTYTKVPAAFSRALLLRGRGADAAETVLPGLKAGRATVENVTFRLPPNPAGQSALVEATDSLIVRDCIFQSATTAFVVDEPGPGSQARIRFERCAFTGLLQAARIAAPAVADVRVAFYDCTFTDCSVGIEISATGVNCSPGGPPAPPVVESDVRATLVRCTFGHTAGTCLNVSNLPGGLLLDKCTFNVNTISINAALTGVLMRDTIIQGDGGAGRGVVVTSSRLEIVRSTVTGHDVGITVRDFPDCRLSSGNLGGNQDDFNRLGGNTTWNLDTSDKLTADYNYWNALNCADAQAKVTGQGLGIICDAVGRPLSNCDTPVTPTTWSRIKATYGPSTAAPGGARPTPPEGRH